MVGLLEAHRSFIFGRVIGVDRIVHRLREIIQVTRQRDNRLVDRLAGASSLPLERTTAHCG